MKPLWRVGVAARRVPTELSDALPGLRPSTLLAHIGVTTPVYAHVRLRLQRDAIDLLGRTLGEPSEAGTDPDDGDEPPLCAAPVR